MTAPVDLPVPATPASAPGSAPAAVADVDRRITLVFRELGLARHRFADLPSGESATACVTAEEELNALLDLRFTLTGPTALPPAVVTP